MHQEKLNDYFSTHWVTSTPNYIYSGFAILDKISPDDKVIDIGCGCHPFKGKIKNLTGIDPANTAADIVTSVEAFEPDSKFDVALCLGSINFGNEDIIANQIEKINNILNLNAKVFWRLNPGTHDHQNDHFESVDLYPWTFEKLAEYADKYGFEQVNCSLDTDGTKKRLYAEWIRTTS